MYTVARLLTILTHVLLWGARDLLGRAWHLVAVPRAARSERDLRLRGRCLAGLLRGLQATFIKIGQALSTRRDLLPAEVIEELETLQDRVPELPYAAIRREIEQDLGRPVEQIFARLEPVPVAAGSIAQVHEGRLRGSGERVAVKVRRPGIGRVIRRDLAIIGALARLLHRLPGLRSLDLPALAAEFGRAIGSQLDFSQEVANCRRFARDFADVPHVRFPRVFDAASGDRVITMSFISGHKLTRLPAELGLDRRLLATRLIDVYHRMVFANFFLHADLHPGNILIDDAGVIHLLDTGLVHAIPRHYVKKFIRVGMALVLMDGRLLAEAYLEDLELTEAQRQTAAEEVEAVLSRFAAKSFSEFEASEVLVEILGLLRRNGIVLDAEWTGMILSDLTFEGIAKSLDGEIDLMQLTRSSLPRYIAGYDFIRPDDPLVAALAAHATRAAA